MLKQIKKALSFKLLALMLMAYCLQLSAQPELTILMNDAADNTGTILLDSLKAYWNMSDANDSYGENDLSNVGVTFVAGKVGNCGDFESTETDYLEIADNPSLSMGDVDMTIAAWFKMESTGDYLPIISKYAAANTREYVLLATQVDCTPDAASFIVSGDGSTITFQCDANTEDTDWHFVVAWHNKTTDSIYIQLDNGTIYQASFAGGINDNSSVVNIGLMLSNGAYAMDGLIDEVAIWKRVLTQAERTYLYNSGSGRTYSGGKIQ